MFTTLTRRQALHFPRGQWMTACCLVIVGSYGYPADAARRLERSL